MNTSIKQTVTAWFNNHPKTKEWAWFIGLWCGGLATVSIATYPLKLLIRSLR